MKEGPSDLSFCALLEWIQSIAPCTTICHFQKHLLKVSISNQRKGQRAVGRGNTNQSPKEKGGKAHHLLFLFVFNIFLWSVGEKRTKASLEGRLSHMLSVLPPIPTKSREGHVQLALKAEVKWSFSRVFALLLHLAGSHCQKTPGCRLALSTYDT